MDASTQAEYDPLPGRDLADSDLESIPANDVEFPQLKIVVEGGSSSISSVFTLCNSAIGAGVLSFPYAFRCAGLVGGIVMCLLVGLTMGFTLFVLVRFTEFYRAHTYQGLIRKAFGKKTSTTLSAILLLYLFGGNIVYLIIVGDTFSSLSYFYLGQGWWSDRRWVIGIIGTFIVLPMCYPKRLGKLAIFSAISVMGFLYTAFIVLVKGFMKASERDDIMEGVKLVNWSTALINAIPMMVFGFQCHTNVVTIYQELAPDAAFTTSTTKPRARVVATLGGTEGELPSKLIGMKTIVALAIVIIMAGYQAVGTAGYLAYPTSVASNVLNTFPKADPFIQIARFMIGIVVITHYPVNHHPARTASEDLMKMVFGIKKVERPWRYLQTTIFFALTLVVAIAVKDLGKVIHLIGGTAAGLLTFGMPGLLLINSVIDLRVWIKTGDPEKARELQHELVARRGDDPAQLPFYSNSWGLGCVFLVMCIGIFILTIYTTIVPINP